MKRIVVIPLTFLAMCWFPVFSLGQQGVSEEAVRHFDRGLVAVEMAKTNADYEDAIREFEQAVRLAPDWPDAYYNLGMVQEKVGKYEEAIRSYEQYLRLAPDADDAKAVKRRINKLEYKVELMSEQADIPSRIKGKWISYNTFCGGYALPIEFLTIHGLRAHQVVRIPVTRKLTQNGVRRMDYSNHPVEIEGSNIVFGFRYKHWFPALNHTSYCDMRFELRLTASNKLVGEVFQDGESLGEVTFVRPTE